MFHLKLLPTSLRFQIRVVRTIERWQSPNLLTAWIFIRPLLARSQNCSTSLKYPINVVCMSIRLAWKKTVPTGRIPMKFDIVLFFENPSRKRKFNSLNIKVNSYLHEDQYTFRVISHSFFLEL